MSTRTRDREREDSEEHGHIRSTGKRPIPFLAPGLVAFVLLPLLFAISRWVKWWDDTTGVMIADWWLGAGCILALVAAYVGVRHAKRAAFVANHVAVTLFAVGIGGHLFTLLGWHHKFMNVSGVFITAIIYGSGVLFPIHLVPAKGHRRQPRHVGRSHRADAVPAAENHHHPHAGDHRRGARKRRDHQRGPER